MTDLGLAAVSKVAELVSFLKIDELRRLVLSQQQQAPAANPRVHSGELLEDQHSVDQQQEIEKLNMLFQ